MIYLKYFNESKIGDIIYGTYIKNKDGTIDVDGHVDLNGKKITKIPFVFGKVSGSFYCNDNKLSSLVGCPNYVGGYFSCSENYLTSLEGCPTYVGGNFSFTHNDLYDFYGIGEVGGDDVWCIDNPVEEIYKLCPDKKFVKYLNEFRPIRGRNILGKRLEECLYMCDVELDVTKMKFENYTLLE